MACAEGGCSEVKRKAIAAIYCGLWSFLPGIPRFIHNVMQ